MASKNVIREKKNSRDWSSKNHSSFQSSSVSVFFFNCSAYLLSSGRFKFNVLNFFRRSPTTSSISSSFLSRRRIITAVPTPTLKNMKSFIRIFEEFLCKLLQNFLQNYLQILKFCLQFLQIKKTVEMKKSFKNQQKL